MAKVPSHAGRITFRWRYLMRQIQAFSPEALKRDGLNLKYLPISRWSKSGKWLLVSGGIAAMICWNERLVLATGSGVAVMFLVYLLHHWKLDIPWANIRKVLQRWNHPIVLSVAAGGVATLLTYVVGSVWVDSESHWIASAAILQGMGTLAVLILLIWQGMTRQADRDRRWFNRAVCDLTHADSLRRLIAVRQLSSFVHDFQDNPTRHQEIADYFYLMLQREQEEIVRNAIMDGLELLERIKSFKSFPHPPVDLVRTKRRVAKIQSSITPID